MPSIQYGITMIDYQITYKKGKKYVSILIEYQIGVTVVAPHILAMNKLQLL